MGEGRGSSVLGSKPNCNTPNSAVKMAEKSAHIDAVLRTFALSDRFYQDLEDIAVETTSPSTTSFVVSNDGSVSNL
jgi:predicted DNA-binding ribbon-helix-helix protein